MKRKTLLFLAILLVVFLMFGCGLEKGVGEEKGVVEKGERKVMERKEGVGYEEVISTAKGCKYHWYECKAFCGKEDNLKRCRGFCEEDRDLCELLPEGVGVWPKAVAGPEVGVDYFKGVYVILAAQPEVEETLRKAKEMGANSVNMVVDFNLGREKGSLLLVEGYKVADAINLAHSLGMEVQLSGGFHWGKELSQSISFEEYKRGYKVAVGELAEIAGRYGVERFEVARELDVVVFNFLLEDAWRGWEYPKVVGKLEGLAGELLEEVGEIYGGKIGIGFAGVKNYVRLPGYGFIGVSIYQRGDAFNFSQDGLADIGRAREYAGDFNGIKELVLGEVALGGLPEEVELGLGEKEEIYKKFFRETWGEVDGYFVFVDEPYPDEELRKVAKEWYGRS